MFIPICYRTVNGEWVNNKSVNGILLVDRQRILFLIDNQQSIQKIVSSQWFLDFENEFIKFGDDEMKNT
jgi:hypothetical protein